MIPLVQRPYRPCVGIMLLNREGRVFVGRRRRTPGEAWQMPQGGIDAGESPRDAALRELAEETGATSVEVLAESREWFDYDAPPEVADHKWGGRYRGQTQKWFAMRFLGEDGEIDLAAHHAEFSAWKWVPIDGLVDLIVPFKRDVYARVVDEFRHLAA